MKLILRRLYSILLLVPIFQYAGSLLSYQESGWFMIICSFLAVICAFIGFNFKNANKIDYLLIFILLIGCFLSARSLFHGLQAFVKNFLTVILLFFASPKDIDYVIKDISRYFKFIISISFVVYLLVVITDALPPISTGQAAQYYYRNFIFYVQNMDYNAYNKFTGFCLEGGYFAVVCIGLLTIVKFDLKKMDTWLYIVAILFSRSLAGYVLLVIGLVFFPYARNGSIKNLTKGLLIGISFIVAVFVFGTHYNHGDNLLNTTVLSRLELTGDEQIIEGNNRESLAAEIVIGSILISDEGWIGIGSKGYEELVESYENLDASSFRVFMVRYGIIYTVLFFFIFNFYSFSKVSKRIVIPSLMLFWADFIQHGLPFNAFFFFMLFYILQNKKESTGLIKLRV